jgi:phosphomannomutase
MSQITHLPAFKAYDVRGRIPDQLNAHMAYLIGRAYMRVIRPQGRIAVGYDIRLSSPSLRDAIIAGLQAEGAQIDNIGMCGTELIYFAAAQSGMGGGIMVTASHNPKDYNGLKMVREQAKPISADTGLAEIEAVTIALMREYPDTQPFSIQPVQCQSVDLTDAYVDKLLSCIDVSALQSMHIVVNAGNGCAGPFFDAIAQYLPLTVTYINHQPDGNFPNGVPNPMLIEQQDITSQAVINEGADFGIAWDGDFDRCFFFDDNGQFIEGYYLVALFAEHLLKKTPNGVIVHDPRLIWSTLENVKRLGGTAQICKCGHSFIKEMMREHDAIYGGEMSAHHYFKDFYYCDSGMLPWLYMLEILSQSKQPLSKIVTQNMQQFPCSGEQNFTVKDPKAIFDQIEDLLAEKALNIDHLDGLSMTFEDWRFNLRSSNTEPVMRLNIETRADNDLLSERLQAFSNLMLTQG